VPVESSTSARPTTKNKPTIVSNLCLIMPVPFS
jgi:hypothetical protein